jgi:signal transduction histidine kinase
VTQRRRVEAELRNLNVELEKRVTERTSALEAANWAKAEFLSVMAHELRTPLNAIIGYTELLEMGIPGPVTEDQLTHLGRIRSGAQRLVGLVGEVLDLGKVEAGQLRVERTENLISDAIDAALALVLPQAAVLRIQLFNQCSRASSLRYIGDRNRVEQILINLLSNATKFTNPGGEVQISCAVEVRPDANISEIPARSEWVALRVHDNGIGLSPKSLESVFDPFVQVEEPLTRTRGGTGLGLTIGRRLARLMGGDLTVESALGMGSTFTLWLPPADGASETSEALERRSPARYPPGLARLGKDLLEQVESIVQAYGRKLKSKRGIPRARDLTKSELEDHAAAFLADIVQGLVAVEDAAGGPSSVMRDGSVVRRIIAERHGAQRKRLGFTEEELRVEFRLLRRALDAGLKRVSSGNDFQRDETSLRAARSVLNRLVDTAEEISVRGFRLAGIDELQNSTESR